MYLIAGGVAEFPVKARALHTAVVICRQTGLQKKSFKSPLDSSTILVYLELSIVDTLKFMSPPNHCAARNQQNLRGSSASNVLD